MIQKIITIVICLAAVFAQAVEFPFPLPARGEPILFSKTEFPIEKWKKPSATTHNWFVEKQNGWYINWDAEAKELKYLVIHHAASSPCATPEQLSHYQSNSLYGASSSYKNPAYKTPYVYDLPAHSGHVINGKETFIAYHHLIYPDGCLKTTLSPFKKVGDRYMVDMIGWGAGNWPVNCSAVQICLIGNFEFEPPSDKALSKLRSLIGAYKALSPNLIVASHKAVKPKPTACPGAWWESWSKSLPK